MQISEYSPRTGRMLREDDSVINEADIFASSPLEVARGRVSGASNISSFGELTTAGAVTDHIVWPLSGAPNLAVPASPGAQMAIVSDSANDAAAGTGIRQVSLIYLDGNLDQQSEIVTLNGTTPINTAATDIRFIQCMHLYAAGSGKKAAGNISATNGGVTYSYIASGKRRCSSSARRVPAGKRLVIHSLYGSCISGAGQARAEIRFVMTGIDQSNLTEQAITFPFATIGVQDCSEAISSQSFVVPAGIVAGFEATIDKAATVNAGFFGFLEPV